MLLDAGSGMWRTTSAASVRAPLRRVVRNARFQEILVLQVCFLADFHEDSYWTLQTQLSSALYRDVVGEGSSLPFVSCRLDSNLVFSL